MKIVDSANFSVNASPAAEVGQNKQDSPAVGQNVILSLLGNQTMELGFIRNKRNIKIPLLLGNLT